MSTNPFGELDVTNRTVKRAQYEALEFALSADGVQVRNNSHANPEDHEYLVEVAEGVPTACNCPADAKYDGACKHRIAVAIRRPILDAVRRQQLVADGGVSSTSKPEENDLRDDENHESEESSDDEQSADCDCADLQSDFPCWECYRSGRRDFPSGY